MVQAPKRKLTADEYQRMGEAGIIGEDERVELLDGELYAMPPIGDDHVGSTISLTYFLSLRVGERALVSVQNPIRLSDYSEPEPDVALLRPRDDFYRKGRIQPQDILLLIEVARSSLDFDRASKLPRYAAAGIIEVWIANLVARRIEVYREPHGDYYAYTQILGPGESVSPMALPDVVLEVDEILGRA